LPAHDDADVAASYARVAGESRSAHQAEQQTRGENEQGCECRRQKRNRTWTHCIAPVVVRRPSLLDERFGSRLEQLSKPSLAVHMTTRQPGTPVGASKTRLFPGDSREPAAPP